MKHRPVHTPKLDRSFVRDIETDHNDFVICAATIALENALGLMVVAEGIETTAQSEFLRSQHCDYFRGYLFGKPMPAKEAMSLLCSTNITVKTA